MVYFWQEGVELSGKYFYTCFYSFNVMNGNVVGEVEERVKE